MEKKMAKKKSSTALGLDKLIPSYGKNKMQSKELEKAAGILNKRIKEIMSQEGIEEKEAGGFVANYTIRTTESFNQEALLEFVKTNKTLKQCVKMAEYVDMDVLENLIYEGKIPKKTLLELDKFRVKKDTAYLTIKQVEDK